MNKFGEKTYSEYLKVEEKIRDIAACSVSSRYLEEHKLER